MGLFGKKVDRDELIRQGIADSEASAAQTTTNENEIHTGNDKVDIELTKIKATLESFGEIRKANQERFSRISEQLGELRGMIVDTNKAMSKIEVAATKAVDLVESVHPEKLMIDVRKQDGKIDAVRAMIESNESIMKDLMGELKRMRSQINFYKGTEQILKMNEEVKHELADIKKQEALLERHADKVETIFLEVSKKFSNFDKYDSTVKELKEGFRKLESGVEKTRAQMIQKEDKKEFVDLLDKFNSFEKHTTNLLTLLDDRSKVTKKEMDAAFVKLRQEIIDEIKSGTLEKAGAAAAVQQQDDDAKQAELEAKEKAEKEAKEAADKAAEEAAEAKEAQEQEQEKAKEDSAKEGEDGASPSVAAGAAPDSAPGATPSTDQPADSPVASTAEQTAEKIPENTTEPTANTSAEQVKTAVVDKVDAANEQKAGVAPPPKPAE